MKLLNRVRTGSRADSPSGLMKKNAACRVVAIGGGTGLSTFLSGLKYFTHRITAVVTVTDEGGSSGRLRWAWGVLPPGDVRNCLVALAKDDALLSRLFQYRFPKRVPNGRQGGKVLTAARRQDSLEGHVFGNLFLTALSGIVGGFDRAVAAASQVLAIQGRVLAASLEPVRLHARLADGRRVLGEPRISKSRVRIHRVQLTPSSPEPSPGVLQSLAEADLIILGPGSLYTSVIPPLLVNGVTEAIARSRALKVYACNVMTQPGETDGYAAADHLQAILDHCKPEHRSRLIDVMVVNDRSFPRDVLKHYARFGSFPVKPPRANLLDGVRIVQRALRPVVSAGSLSRTALARHSPILLAQAVMDLMGSD